MKDVNKSITYNYVDFPMLFVYNDYINLVDIS